MEIICKKLFGETIEKQEEKIKKLIYLSCAMLGVMIILIFVNAQLAEAMIAVIFLMWGWRVFIALSKINSLSELFDYNIVAIVVLLLVWVILGYFAGIVSFLIGIIRYIQILIMKKKIYRGKK